MFFKYISSMLLNIIQILSNHLTNETLIRLNDINSNEFLNAIIRKRLGFIPKSIKDYLQGEHLIFVKSNIVIHFIDNKVHVYMEPATSCSFQVIKDKSIIFLQAYRLSLYSSKYVGIMIQLLKKTFKEFALGSCILCHSQNLKITIHNGSNDYVLTLPYYIKSNITASLV